MTTETFRDSEGAEHTIEAPVSHDTRPEGSPYNCLECGEAANSPAYKRYCWDHYYEKTNGKVFD